MPRKRIFKRIRCPRCGSESLDIVTFPDCDAISYFCYSCTLVFDEDTRPELFGVNA